MANRIVCLTGQEMKLLEAGQLRPLPSEWIARHERNLTELENRYEWRSQGNGAQFMQSRNPFANAAAQDEAKIASACACGDRLLYAVNFNERCGLYLMDVSSPGKGEGIVFSQMGQQIGGMDVRNDRIALSLRRSGGRSSIALTAKDGIELSVVTEGDVQDEDPSFSRDGRSLYYASAGLGRSENGQLLAVGPSAVLRLDMESGTLSELTHDGAFDYLRPREDAHGRLYCLRRPYRKPEAPRSNPLAGAADFFRGLAALGRMLSGKQSAAEKKQNGGAVVLDGRSIDPVKTEAENARSGEEHPGVAPKDWTLVRMAGGEWEQVASGVVDYALTGEGPVISNGRYLLQLNEEGKKQCLARADGVIRLAVLD